MNLVSKLILLRGAIGAVSTVVTGQAPAPSGGSAPAAGEPGCTPCDGNAAAAADFKAAGQSMGLKYFSGRGKKK